MLLSKNEIITILKSDLFGVPEEYLEKAAQSLVEATGKWHEVDLADVLGATFSVQCRDICAIGEAYQKGLRIKAFVEEK